ncbi:MAG TPA: hypothetical protein VGS22_06005 [Thermoanaerobaculia bacterium]|jgi:hypothetical protein|nr:hypothetical protein [Thermoanaerobaculia bacterium]
MKKSAKREPVKGVEVLALGLVALLATYLPARAAAVIALRGE